MAIIAANNWYFVVSYLAVLGAGGVAVPVNPMSPVPEVQRELAAIGARIVIAGPTARATVAGLDRVSPARPGVGGPLERGGGGAGRGVAR